MNEDIKITTGTWFSSGSSRDRTFVAFVETVEDLRRRSAVTATDYEIVQAAGLVRRLLMDGKPTALRVGADLAVRPTFEWTDGTFLVELPGGQQTGIPGPYFDPALAATVPGVSEIPVASSRSGGVEDLLGASLIDFAHDPALTVKDVLRWAAHHRGGVHWDMAHREDSATVERLDHIDRHHSQRMRWTILAVVRVVYRGMEPLIYAGLERTLATVRES